METTLLSEHLLDIYKIQPLSLWSKLFLWGHYLIPGNPYHHLTYSINQDYEKIIPLLQSINEYILINQPPFPTQSIYIYHYHYDLPQEWTRIYTHYSPPIYLLYQGHQLYIKTRNRDALEQLIQKVSV